MAQLKASTEKPRVDGKSFRVGDRKFHLKGVTYGPLAPNGRGEPFGEADATRRDFAMMRELGANLVRVYAVPPPAWLDLAWDHGLRVLVDVPWHQQTCFLSDATSRQPARQAVREAALACGGHPAVFALSVANELPRDVVRWHGARAVEAFLDELVSEVKRVRPECLCTFGNYPPTEFLRPGAVDFVCFNVYLHGLPALQSYLARLQTLADTRPLVLGEFGMDALREGERRQADLVAHTLEAAFRGGLAGACVFSFTDEWYKDGRRIADWQFGLTTADRQRRPAFEAVRRVFAAAPYLPAPQLPKVSVVVASYNGAATLPACLESLARQNYPDYEVILVDDGSADDTPAIAARFPAVRLLRHEQNLGLSAARNTGIAAARGAVVAFTDADCRADEDWLHYLVGDLVRGGFAGIGGHNLAPADDSCVAATVLVSPGGPAHVMLTDLEAEHLPGCNMAFWKSALIEVGCFDPVFRKAGDDVDLCWRLQHAGYRLGFSPAGFVWHARRSTVRAYLRQQAGYGEAEALLARKHPEYFNPLGGGMWRGRIYGASRAALRTRRPVIYHGRFGRGMFQSVYSAAPSYTLMLATSLEYHVLVTLPLFVLSAALPWLLPLALTALLVSLGVGVAAGVQAEIPPGKRRWWSRPLVGLLFGLQPIARGWARYRGRLLLPQTPLQRRENLESLSRKHAGLAPVEVRFPDPAGRGREEFLRMVLARLEQDGWQHRSDSGWSECDAEAYGSRWSKLQLTTADEVTDDGRTWVRCRLRSRWTLPARLAFWGALGATLLAAGILRRFHELAWLLLLLPGALAWFFTADQRNLRRVFAVLLDELAEITGWGKPAADSPPPPGA